ncbi:hypothetical protein BDP27DRAFT_32107 [Rhodocollybia butyracea]|uniref:FAD-binding domain-containing protein n=1 Tax=Rhodocollybia butyracea TaxID=206335 RepID=A0A9P5UGS7_9AGAR|nr:hypothetical protein BDP27DRAFT_32107 [Rhodocollybia butyracea]
MDPSVDALKFIIVGGGIAGLTCAYLLKQAGHQVVVLEKSPLAEQSAIHHGGVKIPPYMTRLMKELPGTEELLKTKAANSTGIFFYQCNDPAELVGKLIYAEEIIKDLGADFYLIPHKDLHNYLLALCNNAAVEFRYDFEVEDIISDRPGPAVVGKSGESVSGDIVIGADGKNSVTRKVLLMERDEAKKPDVDDANDSVGNPAFVPLKALAGATLSIPVSLLQSDPELASLLTEGNYRALYMGNGSNVAMARYGPDLYLLEFTYPGKPLESDDKDEDWLSSGTPTKTVLEKVEEYDHRIKKLLQLVPRCHWNIQNVHNLSRYVSNLNQVVVIGDAAHAIYINGSNNTAAAFEDAFTLGRLFSILSPSDSKSNTSFLLDGYQHIRQKRTKALEKSGTDNMVLLGLPPGPERDGRNNGFRLTLHLEGADDATLERVWKNYIDRMHYESRDEVSEWWMNWARPGGNFETSSWVRIPGAIATGNVSN